MCSTLVFSNQRHQKLTGIKPEERKPASEGHMTTGSRAAHQDLPARPRSSAWGLAGGRVHLTSAKAAQATPRPGSLLPEVMGIERVTSQGQPKASALQKPDTHHPWDATKKRSRSKGELQMSSHYLTGLVPAARTSDCHKRGK